MLITRTCAHCKDTASAELGSFEMDKMLGEWIDISMGRPGNPFMVDTTLCPSCGELVKNYIFGIGGKK